MILADLKYSLGDFYINAHLAASIFPDAFISLFEEITRRYDRSQPNQRIFWRKHVTNLIIDFVQTSKTENIQTILLEKHLQLGQIVMYFGQGYFKALKGKEVTEAADRLFHTKLELESQYTIKALLHSRHCTNDTALGKLSGNTRIWLFGVVTDIKTDEIVIRPVVFADLILDSTTQPSLIRSARHKLRVYASEIDQFSGIEAIQSEASPAKLKNIPEKVIKEVIASLLNEGNIPKDWGGESSDLYTRNVRISGEQMRTAFLLKGPAKFHSMKVSDLGKNGDQIKRLYDEPADLFVLQHCHYVTAAVESMMEAYASRYFRISRYMIIDGIETLKLLKLAGKI